MKMAPFWIVVRAGLCLSVLIESAGAWGFQAHRLINEQAIRMIPPPLQTFFRNNLRFVREHSIDPDLWRQAEQEPEGNHFFEVDSFPGLSLEHWPADEPAFLRTFGNVALQHGRLPWRVMEVYRNLTDQLRKGNWVEARLQAAALGHYVADAYVPFHATRNYDGQLTGNLGIHARWEAQLVERFEQQIRPRLREQSVEPIHPSPETIIRILVDGLAACGRILENDSRSVGRQLGNRELVREDPYTDAYYSQLFALEEADLVRRIQDSATRIAEIWYSAWVDAARPSFPLDLKDHLVRGDHRLVLLSWDGTSPELLKAFISRGRLPILKKLLTRAVYSDDVSANLPSLTAPGHAAIWTGAWADRNGITSNQVPYPISPEKSVLDYESGFSSSRLQAEPIWLTAARQGLETLVLQAIQIFPFEPFTSGRRFGGDQSRRLTLIDGYSAELSMNDLVGPDTKFHEPNGWQALPPLVGQAKEFSFQIGNTTLYGILFDSPLDPIVGYDSMIVTPDKTDKRRFLLLKSAESPDYSEAVEKGELTAWRTWDLFGEPIWVPMNGEDVPVYFRLLQLDKNEGRFLLLHSWVYHRTSSRPELMRSFQERTGGFWGHAGIHLYRRGLLGIPIMEGGKGEAERRYLETVALVLRQYSEATIFALRQMKWDLLINYIPLPDEVCHAWLGWTDSSSPTYNAHLATALAPYLEAALVMQDQSLGRILDNLPLNAAVALVSDHSVQGIGKDFRPNSVLNRAGLLALRPDGSLDLARTRIYAASEGTLLLVNSARRKNGVVEDSDREGVLRLAERALLAVRDPETGQPVVTRVINPLRCEKAPGTGGPFGGDLYYELATGYAPQRMLIGEPVARRQVPTGSHALSWTTARTGFLLSGPEVRKCINLGPAKLIDLAPTFCRYLGIEPPANSEGKILEGAFEQPSSPRP